MGRIALFLGMLSLILPSCFSTKEKKIPTQPISKLRLTKLKALDLSENASRLSTQNDEIFLMINLLEKVNGQTIFVQEFLRDDLVFDTIRTNAKFSEVFSISKKENQYLAITLVELDEENSSLQVQKNTRTILQNLNFSKRINRLDYTDQFGDDDLLGLKVIALDNCCLSNKFNLLIDGVSLMDKYAYRIEFEVE